MSLEILLRPNPVQENQSVHVIVRGSDLVPGDEFISHVTGLLPHLVVAPGEDCDLERQRRSYCLHTMGRSGIAHLDYTANMPPGTYTAEIYNALPLQDPTPQNPQEPHERLGNLLGSASLSVLPVDTQAEDEDEEKKNRERWNY